MSFIVKHFSLSKDPLWGIQRGRVVGWGEEAEWVNDKDRVVVAI